MRNGMCIINHMYVYPLSTKGLKEYIFILTATMENLSTFYKITQSKES